MTGRMAMLRLYDKNSNEVAILLEMALVDSLTNFQSLDLPRLDGEADGVYGA